MRYFEDTKEPGIGPNGGNVYAYDPNTQQNLIDQAITSQWNDLGTSWTPPAPSPPPLPDQAQAELDIVTGPRGQAIRAFVAGIPLTSTWQTYINNLRAIANGTDTTSTSLPAKPSYIKGT